MTPCYRGRVLGFSAEACGGLACAEERHLVCLANGEAMAKRVLRMQPAQQLAVHAVLDRVHHACLGQHGPALLLYPGLQELSLEGHLPQCIQHLRRDASPVKQAAAPC